MKRILISILFLTSICHIGTAQDIELSEGSLKLTTVAGLGIPQTATISNSVGVLKLDPTSGNPVLIDIGHNLEIANGNLQIGGDVGLEFQTTTGQIMTLRPRTAAAGFGGLSILSNGSDESYYFDDDENYLSIGIDMNSIIPAESNLDIQQSSNISKAIRIRGANGFPQVWDLSILANGNLALTFNDQFKGQFSRTDGAYTPAGPPPPAPPMLKNNTDSTSAAQSSDPATFVSEGKTLEQLINRLAQLEQKVKELESKL